MTSSAYRLKRFWNKLQPLAQTLTGHPPFQQESKMDGKDIQRVKAARILAKRTFKRKCNLFEDAAEQDTIVMITGMCKEVCDAFF